MKGEHHKKTEKKIDGERGENKLKGATGIGATGLGRSASFSVSESSWHPLRDLGAVRAAGPVAPKCVALLNLLSTEREASPSPPCQPCARWRPCD